jgi:hypothetical protein
MQVPSTFCQGFIEWNGQCNISYREGSSALETAQETVNLQLKQIMQSR